MDVSVLIPWRTDHGHRARLFVRVLQLWADLPVEVVIGTESGEGPFNAAAAFNDAAACASGDVFVLHGADQIPDLDRISWATQQLTEHAWCRLFATTSTYSEADTERILAGLQPQWDYATVTPSCTGIVAVTRDAWAEVHGMDERYEGWGYEDVALTISLDSLHGPSPEPADTLRSLWHPPAPRDHSQRNWALTMEYYRAQADDRMRDYIDTRADFFQAGIDV